MRSLAAALLILAVPLAAQQPSLADSAMKLNRAGEWAKATDLVIAGFGRATTPSERCPLIASLAYALARMERFDSAIEELKAFDRLCADEPAALPYKRDLDALRPELALPALPTTGLDFSGVDAFWPVADLLMQDKEPSDAQWRAMFSTVGYRLAMNMIGSTRSDMEIALMPSKRAVFDSVTNLETDQAARVKHIARAATHRAQLAHYRDSVAKALPVRQAVALASRYLPPHATEGKDPPLVAFAIFRDDAYSVGPQQIIVDMDHVLVEGGLTELLAHEFHHSYLAALNRVQFATTGAPDGILLRALNNARNEGIADLIDKPYPLHYDKSPGMSAYAKRYNEAYARTPQVIHSIDSALTAAADDSTKIGQVGIIVQRLLPSNGHYNGSYVAREILETFGVDSLLPGVYDPFAFWRAYGEAEVKNGRAWPFSAKSQALLDALEKRYVRAAAVP